MKKSVILTALVSLVLSSSALNASADKAAHKDFLALEKLAKKNDKRDFYRALKQSSHPLAPYAEAAYLANSPWLANQQEIKKFLDTYQGTPLEWKVRYAWLDNLKKSNKKALYI